MDVPGIAGAGTDVLLRGDELGVVLGRGVRVIVVVGRVGLVLFVYLDGGGHGGRLLGLVVGVMGYGLICVGIRRSEARDASGARGAGGRMREEKGISASSGSDVVSP